MKSINENEIIENILESGRLIEEAIYSGDYKLNNREGAKTYKLFKKLFNLDREIFLNKCVPILLEKGNYSVKVCVYDFLLDMHIRENEMVENLMNIVNDPNARIFSHRAKMCLGIRGYEIK